MTCTPSASTGAAPREASIRRHLAGACTSNPSRWTTPAMPNSGQKLRGLQPAHKRQRTVSRRPPPTRNGALPPARGVCPGPSGESVCHSKGTRSIGPVAATSGSGRGRTPVDEAPCCTTPMALVRDAPSQRSAPLSSGLPHETHGAPGGDCRRARPAATRAGPYRPAHRPRDLVRPSPNAPATRRDPPPRRLRPLSCPSAAATSPRSSRWAARCVAPRAPGRRRCTGCLATCASRAFKKCPE